jgi:tetratricopeptide (TPR) repeat protein
MLMPENSQVLMDLSNLLLDTGETTTALSCLKRLVDMEPNNANAFQNLAVVYFHCDRYEEGIAACKKSLQCDPRHVMAMYNLAVAFEHLGQFDAALGWVRSALATDSCEPIFQKLEFRLRVMQLRSRVTGAMKRVLRLRKSKQSV